MSFQGAIFPVEKQIVGCEILSQPINWIPNKTIN